MGFAQQLQKLSKQPMEEQKLISDGISTIKEYAQKLTLNGPKLEEKRKSQTKGRDIGM